MLIIYALIVGAVGWLYVRMPSAFLPNEDQGNLIVNVQLPRARRATHRNRHLAGRGLLHEAARSAIGGGGVVGFSFSGTGQNAALGFVT